jgi:folate-binding protein YgfZ
MMDRTAQTTADYTALVAGAAVLVRPDAGVLVLGDADRVDFLQRMTTNHVAGLRPGQACVTVLTSPTAKIVQVFTVLARADDLLLLPAAGETAALAKALRGQIFFMDKVTVADASARHSRLRVAGPEAEAALRRLGFFAGGAAANTWEQLAETIALAQPEYDLPGFELLVPAGESDAWLARLQEAGAVVLAGDAAYAARRVELGRPAHGAELTGEYNPLEAGLAWACAENKGCYTGQEIIARQVTYDKVTRTLVGLRTAVLAAPGAPVSTEGRETGVVTSSAFSPALGAPVALAILKRPANTPGTPVLVGETPGEVVALPFTE